MEVVPELMKSGVIVPIYKGSRKDPLKVNSYRWITLTSMVSKVLDFLVLECLGLVFKEAGLLHINQSAYRKVVSCADVNLRGCSHVYVCLYDLQKGFHSVEYPVLL